MMYRTGATNGFAKALRVLFATVLATPVAIAASGASPVSATTALAVNTHFEIDGDLTGTYDWTDGYGPGVLTPDGNQTTGLYHAVRTSDVCNAASDDIALGGTALGDGPVWPTVSGEPNDKTDLEAVWVGAEKVVVPGAGGSQIHDFLYLAFELCNTSNGTFNAALIIEGGDGQLPYTAAGVPTGSTDDYLVVFDFQGGANGTGRIHTFNGSSWNPGAMIPAGSIEVFLTDGDRAVGAGEVAVNLTELQILPSGPNAACRTISVQGQAATPTGGSLTSQIKDVIDVPPFEISNCGALDVTKASNPAGITSTDVFHYEVDQADAAVVYDDTLDVSGVSGTTEPEAPNTEVDADILIGDTDSWVNILSEPDYQIRELQPPTGWTIDTITCSYTDIFAAPPAVAEVTIYENGAYVPNAQFLVPPAVFNDADIAAASCVITNSTSGVVVAKAGAGSATDFDFTVDGEAVTVALGGSSDVIPFTPGSTVTITELAEAATPGWNFAGVVCDDTGATSSLVDPTVDITTVAGEVITCTFTNNQQSVINVTKVTDPADSADTFDFTVTGLPNIAGLGNGDSGSTGDIDPGTYTVTELLDTVNADTSPDWALTAIDCGTPDLPSNSTEITLAAGDVVNCTFTNRQMGEIVVVKNVDVGDGSFDFVGSVPGTIATVDGTGQISDEVVPGEHTVTETVPAGFTLDSTTCPAPFEVAAGATVTCEFNNSRNAATFTIVKDWGDANALDAVALTASAAGGVGPYDDAVAASAIAPIDGAVGDNQLTVYSGQTVTFDEAFTTGSAGDYNISVSCLKADANGSGTFTPVGDSGGTWAAGDTPSDVTCTVTNTLKTSGIVLQKVWNDPAAVSAPGASAVLTATVSGGGDSDSATSNSDDAPVFLSEDDATDNSAFVTVFAGNAVTFTEDLGADADNFGVPEFACTGATNAPAAGGDVYTYTLLIDQADDGNQIECEFTNTRKSVDLTVTKTWEDAIIGDGSTVAATGSATTPIALVSTADTTDETDGSTTFTVYAGESLDFSETFAVGTNPNAYDAVFACTGNSAPVPADSPTVDISGTDTAISCGYTNSRRSVGVVVAKSLAPVGDDGLFDLSIGPDEVVSDATDGDSNAATPVTVFIGDSVSVSELADAASPALENYTTTLSCGDSITLDPNDATSGTFEVPDTLDSGATITCTFVNTRNEAQLTVTKDWVDSPKTDDEVALTIAGGLATSTPGTNVNDAADAVDTDATTTVYGGESITVTEAFAAGFDADNYDTSLMCVDGSGTLLDTVDLLTGTLDIAAAPTDITCTFSNDRKSTTLDLQKRWVNAQQGDQAILTIVGESGQPDGAATSTAIAGNSLDIENVASMIVYAGESIALSEDLGDAGIKYVSNLTCEGAQATNSGASGSVAVTADHQGVPITCTFRNERKSLDLLLDKSWPGAPANGDTVEMTLTGGLLSANPGAADDPAINSNGAGDDTVGNVTALLGDTITLTETFSVGQASDYLTTLTCSAGGATVLTYTTGDLMGDFFVDPLDAEVMAATEVDADSITCTFDNRPAPVMISVTKLVDGGLADNTDWGPFTMSLTPAPDGETAEKSVTKAAPTATWIDLVPGNTYTIAEIVPDGGYPGFTPGTTALTCTGVTDTVLDDGPLAVTFVAPLASVDVDCTITNTANSDVSQTKVVDPENPPTRAADGAWTVSYLLTVSNADAAGQGVYDLDDAFNFGGGVSIVAGSAAVVAVSPADLSIVAGFTGEAGNTSIADATPIAPGAVHTYRVTVDVTIAVTPQTDGDCAGGPGEGTGFLNEMTISVDGGEPDITPACAEFATLTLIKQVDNSSGGQASTDDFVLTATGPATISGTTLVASAVPVGQYTLSETQIAGYSTDGYTCTGGSVTAGMVTVGAAATVVCTIVNVADEVDLELTKDDGGATAVAGGDPFTYTISVQNSGDRNVDVGEPVTVTDQLPVGLLWVTIPANCTQAGQTITCTLTAESLPAGGAPVVITATVRATAAAASGIYVNQAWVTTTDDPMCVGADCTPPPCPAVTNNNVDCENTPVGRDGAIQIVKVDDVADTDAVSPGDTFNYSLAVTNTGVSSILPGLEVTDDLPAQLELVSVTGGTGWTCNAVDPVVCVYGPALAPGASASSITVLVRVAAAATGTNVVNTAVVRGAVDRDCDDVEVIAGNFTAACNEVTDDDGETTPLALSADLAIVKSAESGPFGPASTFDWVLQVTNNGPGTAVDVVVTDQMPAALAVLGVSSDEFACGFEGNEITCTLSSLAVGEVGEITISTKVPDPNTAVSVTNLGVVESTTPDPDLSNNTDEATVPLVESAVEPPPDPTVPELPKTGAGQVGNMVDVGLLLMLLGGGVLLIARRRRDEELKVTVRSTSGRS